jgi:hypothetical protein
MKVFDKIFGRLGNAIFRYFASTLFCIIYNCERIYSDKDCNKFFNDNDFIEWSNEILNNNIPELEDGIYMFDGYFQHDNIYKKYKKEIILWIINHPEELIYSDDKTFIKAIDLIHNPYVEKYYNVVLHIRLEDFVQAKLVLDTEVLKNLLDKINEKDICIVINKPTTYFENKYIDYFKNFYNVIVESNSVIEDFHILKNANILICSCSIMSWTAALLSEFNKTVYMPDYPNRQIHETFKKPIENTILYEYKLLVFNKYYNNNNNIKTIVRILKIKNYKK